MFKNRTQIMLTKINIKTISNQHDYRELLLRLKIIYKFYFLYF